MSTAPSTEELLESLTGFDEIAIAQQFGAEIAVLAETKPTTLMRALVFVTKRRDGMNDADAKHAAMEMTLGQVNAHFADDEDEVFPDHPVTESGKDGSQPA